MKWGRTRKRFLTRQQILQERLPSERKRIFRERAYLYYQDRMLATTFIENESEDSVDAKIFWDEGYKSDTLMFRIAAGEIALNDLSADEKEQYQQEVDALYILMEGTTPCDRK